MPKKGGKLLNVSTVDSDMHIFNSLIDEGYQYFEIPETEAQIFVKPNKDIIILNQGLGELYTLSYNSQGGKQ